MLTTAVAQAASYFQPIQIWFSHQIRVEALLFFFGFLAYFSWWVIRFTLIPSLYPHDPSELSYPIPIFGHAKAFFENSHRLVAQGMEPFALTVAGKLYYVIPSPEDAKAFIKNVTTLSWDEFLASTLVGFGIDPSRLKPLLDISDGKSDINPKGKALMNLTEDLCKQQLLPGPKLDDLLSELEHTLQDLLSPHAIQKRFHTRAPISLLSLCTVLIEVTQRTLFDHALQQIDPDMVEGMVEITDQAWKLMNPSFFVNSRQVDSLKAHYIESLTKYVGLPKSSRNRESWLVSTVIEAYQAAGVVEHDIAVVLLMVYWAYMLFDDDLYQSIKDETECCIKDSLVDLRHLTDNCPLLKSVYHESMRLTKRDVSIRKVTKDTLIGGKLLREGNLAFIPYCQLHTVGEIWGETPELFSPRRFMDRADLLASPNYRPFGGGLSYCPGRFLVGPQIFSFIALLIHSWDIRLYRDDCQASSSVGTSSTFPSMDDSTITLGISRPKSDSKVLVQLERKRPL